MLSKNFLNSAGSYRLTCEDMDDIQKAVNANESSINTINAKLRLLDSHFRYPPTHLYSSKITEEMTQTRAICYHLSEDYMRAELYFSSRSIQSGNVFWLWPNGEQYPDYDNRSNYVHEFIYEPFAVKMSFIYDTRQHLVCAIKFEPYGNPVASFQHGITMYINFPNKKLE